MLRISHWLEYLFNKNTYHTIYYERYQWVSVVRLLVDNYLCVVVADRKDIGLNLHVKNRSVYVVGFSCYR